MVFAFFLVSNMYLLWYCISNFFPHRLFDSDKIICILLQVEHQLLPAKRESSCKHKYMEDTARSLNSNWAPLFAEVSEEVTRSSCVFEGEVIECWGSIEDTLASC